MKIKSGFKQRLKSLRISRGYSQKQVESLTGGAVSCAYICKLETGIMSNPSPHILWALSKVYRIPYIQLMEYAGYITKRDVEIARVRFLT